MPVRNGEPYLDRAIESILGQTFDDLVLVISDNGSTDRTQEICKGFANRDNRVRYHRSDENRGAAWNYNRVFELSDSRYFKWAAHDDYMAPEFLERCVEVLDGNPGLALCITGTSIVDADGKQIGEIDDDLDLTAEDLCSRYRSFCGRFSHLKNFQCNPVFGLIRAEVLRETSLIGAYWGSDAVLLGELALRGKFASVPALSFFRREHSQRALLVNRSVEALTAWFDPRKIGRWRFPRWRCLFEHGRALLRMRMSVRQRLSCFWALLRSTRWRLMVRDVRNVAASYFRRSPA